MGASETFFTLNDNKLLLAVISCGYYFRRVYSIESIHIISLKHWHVLDVLSISSEFSNQNIFIVDFMLKLLLCTYIQEKLLIIFLIINLPDVFRGHLEATNEHFFSNLI